MDGEFFAKQNKKLQEENERLRRRLEDQQADLDKLEYLQTKNQAAQEKREATDKFYRNSSIKPPRNSTAVGAGGKLSCAKAAQSVPAPRASKAPALNVAAASGGGSQASYRESKSGGPSSCRASTAGGISHRVTVVSSTGALGNERGGALDTAPAGPADDDGSRKVGADTRKLLDEFKKPLDDTRALIDKFAMGRQVPTTLLIAQVDAMRDAMRRLTSTLQENGERLDGLQARSAKATSLDRAARTRLESSIATLNGERRRQEEELSALRKRFAAVRDDVVQRTTAELCKAVDGYDKAFDDLLKPKGEAAALDRLLKLSAPLSLEAYEEREGGLRQPPDLGAPLHMRTLLTLAQRADGASKADGPLERLAREAAGQGGPGCVVTVGACKGFRRALQKAHVSYGGDYLLLSDMARCMIIAPKVTSVVECVRWLIEDAKLWAIDDEDLPSFEPLVVDDKLSYARLAAAQTPDWRIDFALALTSPPSDSRCLQDRLRRRGPQHIPLPGGGGPAHVRWRRTAERRDPVACQAALRDA